MRYRRAVEKLRILADACEDFTRRMPLDEPFIREAYVFGDVLSGSDPLEVVEVVLTLNLPPEEVLWGDSEPRGTAYLIDFLRLEKGGFSYYWRSYLDPVPNHYVRGPVRFWSLDGPDQDVFQALVERRFDDLPRLGQTPEAHQEQMTRDLDAALSHLRAVRSGYWEDDWRREHRGGGRYPEHFLWEAVDGYLDLLDATVEKPEP
jgi:hypothetical protein